MATFKIQSSPLPTTFRGTLQQFFEAMLDRMEIVSDGSLFTISDTAPSGNEGPWLKGGTKWYVWDDSTSGYVPLDVSDSISQQIVVADETSTPDPTKFQFWLQTSGSTIVNLFYYVGQTSGWQPIFTNGLVANSIAASMLQTGCVTANAIADGAVGNDELATGLSVNKFAQGTADPNHSASGNPLVGSDGTKAVWVKLIIESPENSFTGGAQVVAQTHSLGSVPNILRAVFRCKTAEGGYVVGDEIDVTTLTTGANGKTATLYANATNMYLILQGLYQTVLSPSTPSNGMHLTPTNWAVVFYYGRG